jgi:hypothetical protein
MKRFRDLCVVASIGVAALLLAYTAHGKTVRHNVDVILQIALSDGDGSY